MYPNNNIELNTVFGNAIECPIIKKNPTNNQIYQFRKKYIKELLSIGDKNNVKITIIPEF